MLKQLSIFMENRQGMMQKITGMLADAEINIYGSVTNDSAEYGIIRMIVSDPEKALSCIKSENILCQLTDVIGIQVDNEPGSLDKLLIALSESNINIDYIYFSYITPHDSHAIIIHADDIFEVESCLSSKNRRLF